ncbi:hypothetical protein CNYM01_00098 [Colletotrichum nymphaeae SA-01]|uniref:Uncharacterized protein n=1 Tax=Colletotrichum nymphaeae SA-01 TaxID=1460502 RepID=A0A135UJP1_9PEZI|nr:hypothetical protein CNYM01_00098 [Colletotrichum nymphaeae SA-01]
MDPSVQFAKPGAVPTREEILAFRRATWLLARFKAVNSAHGTTLRLKDHQTIAQSIEGTTEERRFIRKQYDFLDCLAGILVRNTEVLALIPSSDGVLRTNTRGKEKAQQKNVNVVYLSTNPRFEDHPIAPDIVGAQGPALLVDFDTTAVENFDFNFPDGVTGFIHDKWARMTIKEIASGQHFIECCLLIIRMLKQYFYEKDGGKKETMSAGLKDFIYLSSQGKIRRRFEGGTIFRNYVAILAMPVSNLAQLHQEKRQLGASASTPSARTPLSVAEVETQAALDDKILSSRPPAFLTGGRELPTTELKLKFRTGQTTKQVRALRAVYKEAVGWRQDGIGRNKQEHGCTLPLFHTWENSPLNARGQSSYRFYDVKGRNEMQRILASIFIALQFYQDRFKGTQNFVNSATMKRKVSREDAILKCKAASDDLQRAYFVLAGIRREFSEVLDSHFQWLQFLTGVTTTHVQGRGFSSRPTPTADSPNPAQNKMAIYAEPGTGPDGAPLWSSPPPPKGNNPPATPIRGSGSARQEPPTPGLSKGFSKINISSGPEDPDDIFETELLSFDNDARVYGWNVAAAQYLGSICRVYDSLLIILESEKAVIEHFLATEFQPLKTYPRYQDKEIADLQGFLETFELAEGETLPQHLVTKWVEYLGDPGHTTFSGTWHAEATILSLHLLEKDRARMVDANVVAGSSAAGEACQLPAAGLTRLFRSLGTAMAVNKRCCPVCYFLVEYIQQTEDTKFLFEGAHSDWSATTLSPWIPKKAFDAIYHQVLRHLRRVFQEKVYEDATNRSDDSGGTRSAPGRSSAGSGPGADDRWYTQNQASRDARPPIDFDTPKGGGASSKGASGRSAKTGTGPKQGKGGNSSGARAGSSGRQGATSGQGGASGGGSGRRAQVGSAPPPFNLPGASGRATNVAGSQMGGDDPFVDTQRGGAPPGASQSAAGGGRALRPRPGLPPPLTIPPAGHSRAPSSPTKRHASSEVPHQSSPSPKKK